MKAFIVAVDGTAYQDLAQAGTEQLPQLKWLMQVGCYGKLTDIPQPAAASAHAIGDELERAGMLFQTADATFSTAQALESALNDLLRSLDDDTVVLLVFDSGYILAAPSSPVQGETENANLEDLAATLLQLGGMAVPESLGGRSLLPEAQARAADQADHAEDEEEIVRKRLEGLGYI